MTSLLVYGVIKLILILLYLITAFTADSSITTFVRYYVDTLMVKKYYKCVSVLNLLTP